MSDQIIESYVKNKAFNNIRPISIATALSIKPQKLDFILPGLITGTVGAIVSPGASGKSSLILQLCAEVSGGAKLLGIENIKEGKAVFLPGEDPEIAIHHRLFALGERCNLKEREALAQNLKIYPLETYTPNILNNDWFNWLMDKATGSQIMAIDTLRIIHHLDENDSSSMTRVISKFKEIASHTGCAVVFLHHTSKASALNGLGGEQQASRGSSVLVDNIRWQGYLRTMTEAEAVQFGIQPKMRRYFVEFGISKQNFGNPTEPFWLRKVSCSDKEVEGGFTLQKAVLDTSEPKKYYRGRD